MTSHQVVENSIPIANYSFSYDAGGNALTRELDGTSENFEYSTDNRISTVDSSSAQYDNDGNLLSITIDGVTKNYSYDSRNRLTGDSQVTYSYDSEDRRISKTVGTDTTLYAIDPSERLSKVLVKTINGVSTYYVYGLGLISEETNADYKLYHFDYRGSTILLTDGTGQITDSYSYGPFGNVENHTGTSNVDYLFLGQFGLITDENELTFMNDRYYAPYIGSFLNEDPYSLRYNDITNLNLYGYCGNDPINNVDPSGNFFETLFDIVNVAFSAEDFFSDPTIVKFGILAWDTAAAFLPFIPGSYVAKGASLVDDAFDLARSGPKLLNSADASKQIMNAERVESALKNDIYHRAASFVPKSQLASGKTFSIVGGDGVQRTLLQVGGEVNGKIGIFEYLLDPNGTITHQLFKPGGIINGKIN